MKRITKNILKYLGYTAFSILSFLVCVYITFPMEAVQHRLDSEIAKASDGKITIKAKKLELAGLSGLRFKEANIFITGENGTPNRVSLDKFEAKVHLIGTISRLLSKKQGLLLGPLAGIDVKLVQGDGKLDCTITEEQGYAQINADINKIKIERLLPAFVSLPVPIRGEIIGKLDGKIKKQWYTNGQGAFKLTINNLSVGEGSIKTALGPFEMPLIDLGTVQTMISLEQGAIKISDWQQSGKDLEASSINGKITLQKKTDNSAIDIKLSFKPSADFLSKNKKFGAMLQMAGLKKDDKDNYNLDLGGKLGSPKIKGGPRIQ